MKREVISSWAPQPASSHVALFEQERQNVQKLIAEVSHRSGVRPSRIFVIIADLRSEFGRAVALHFAERTEIDRQIRAAETRREIPGFAVPVADERGLEIIRMFVPDLEEQVTQRPPLTVAMLLVDEHDDPLIAIGRLLDARFAVS